MIRPHMCADHLLIAKISKGDMNAFKTLFERYYSGIHSFVAGVVGDDYPVEDITQNVFIRLWIKREGLDAGKNLKNFIYTLTKHEIADYFRSEKLYLRSLRLDMLTDAVSTQETISSSFNVRQIKEMVFETVDQMPLQRQQVFKLSRIEGMTNDDIAKKLNISKRTVEGHLNVALKTIRSIYGPFTCWLLAYIFI